MSCDQYKKWDLGEISQSDFEAHIKNCAECQQSLEGDNKLLTLAQTLKAPVQAPQLWDRIEQNLNAEIRTQKAILFTPTLNWLIAAILIMGLGLGYMLTHNNEPTPPGLLSYEALSQIEKAERDYIAAIERLEQTAQTRLADLPSNLSTLYQSKLTLMDEQIAQCQDALQHNPANAHIRRHLLAALQNKKQTLTKITATEIAIQ